MAARRVLIAVLAFVGGISIVAALVPVDSLRSPQDETTSTRSTTEDSGRSAATPRAQPGGSFLRETVRLGETEKPAVIEAELGDQLELLVFDDAGRPVEVSRTGLDGFADRYAPARFDFTLDQLGTYEIRPLGGGEPLAMIEVRDPERAYPEREQGRDGAQDDGPSADDPMAPELESA